LAELAASGNEGRRISVPLDLGFWLDRDTTDSDNHFADIFYHETQFRETVKNINRIGLSFHGGDFNFGDSCGVDAHSTARFKLYDFWAE